MKYTTSSYPQTAILIQVCDKLADLVKAVPTGQAYHGTRTPISVYINRAHVVAHNSFYLFKFKD